MGPFHERRAATFGQKDPIGMAVGHRESLRAGGADQHRWRHPRRLFQSYLRELDVGAAHGHRLTGQQLPDRRSGLGRRGQTFGGQRPDLRHPLRHPVTERRFESTRVHATERRDLHCRDRGVAHRDGQQPHSDPDRFRHRQRRGGQDRSFLTRSTLPDVASALAGLRDLSTLVR